jgi:hypothetical protein
LLQGYGSKDKRKVKGEYTEAFSSEKSALLKMWKNIIAWCSLHLRSRYVRMLEQDVERLRAENRALVNSLLGTAGFPPLSLEEDARRGGATMSPVRRRTWTQIARERELAAGRASAEK